MTYNSILVSKDGKLLAMNTKTLFGNKVYFSDLMTELEKLKHQ